MLAQERNWGAKELKESVWHESTLSEGKSGLECIITTKIKQSGQMQHTDFVGRFNQPH